jgi:hypothetical protein
MASVEGAAAPAELEQHLQNDMPDDFVSCRQPLFHSFQMPASQGIDVINV